jgi:hypothetical protein
LTRSAAFFVFAFALSVFPLPFSDRLPVARPVDSFALPFSLAERRCVLCCEPHPLRLTPVSGKRYVLLCAPHEIDDQ